MYRSRLSIWISCVCIIICLGLGVRFVKWLSADPAEYNMYCTSSDNIIKSNISDISGDYEFNLYDTRENTDFIIQPTSNETINGYTKYNRKKEITNVCVDYTVTVTNPDGTTENITLYSMVPLVNLVK
jgi:hypothetical protein